MPGNVLTSPWGGFDGRGDTLARLDLEPQGVMDILCPGKAPAAFSAMDDEPCFGDDPPDVERR